MNRLAVVVAVSAAVALGTSWRAERHENATRDALARARSVAERLPARMATDLVEPGAIVVDLVDGTPASAIAEIEAKVGIKLEAVSAQSAEDGIEVTHVRPGSEQAVLDALADDPRVECAEPNYQYHALYEPNDPRFGEQWHMKMINAPAAWDITAGQGVTVAVIDTGIAYESNGRFYQVEDLKGIEFVAPMNFLTGKDHANDDHGHGTHVAGTIAQATNNGVGVAGVAYKAKLMPLKVLSASGSGGIGPIAQSIRWAADKGAKVINMSLGGPLPSRVLEQACDYAKKKGVLVVCAAGNDGREKISYPAAYASCVSVSAVRPDGVLSWYSNYGKGLTIAAPGGDTRWGGAAAGVLQNCINPSNIAEQGYYAFQGTSMASPHVAGAAALVMSMGVTDPDACLKVLKETAQKKDDARRYGAGIIDCAAAVKKAKKDQESQPLGVALAFALLGLAPLGLRAALRTVRGAGLSLFAGVAAGACGALALPGRWSALSVTTFGAEHHVLGLTASTAGLFVAVLLLSGVPRFRGLLAGLAFGLAGSLAVSACAVAPSFSCGSFMVTQAMFLAALGSLVLAQKSRERRSEA